MNCLPDSFDRTTVLRLTEQLDCSASQLGREGYRAFADYAVESGMVTAALVVFVAIFGLTLALGRPFELRELPYMFGRIGLVLALLVSWPAFQTLFYDLAIAGPDEIAREISSATAIDVLEVDRRADRVYEALRLGSALDQTGLASSSATIEQANGNYRIQPPMPLASTVFLVATIGLKSATDFAAAFLLSIGPIPILSLLFFAPGLGFFVSWIRALLTAILASAGVGLVASLHILAIESELERVEEFAGAPLERVADRQDFIGLSVTFAVCAIAVIAVSAMATKGMTLLAQSQGARLVRSSDHRPARKVPIAPRSNRSETIKSRHSQSLQLATDRVDSTTRSIERDILRTIPIEQRQRPNRRQPATANKRPAPVAAMPSSAAARGRAPTADPRIALHRWDAPLHGQGRIDDIE